MEKFLVAAYIVIFLVFCMYIWNYLNRDNGSKLNDMPRVGSKEYYKRLYVYHSKMRDKHAKKAQRALRKYKSFRRTRGWWR